MPASPHAVPLKADFVMTLSPGSPWLRALSVVSLLLGVSLSDVAAQPTTGGDAEMARLLAMPPSPGALAMLQPYAAQADVRTKWKAGLSDQTAENRAAAARLIHANGLRFMAPALLQALAKEEDQGAALEELLALVVLGDAGTDSVAAKGAARLGGRAAALFAAALLANRPDQFHAHITALGPGIPGMMLGPLVAQAASTAGADQQLSLASVVLRNGSEAWRTFLCETRRLNAPIRIEWMQAPELNAKASHRDDLTWAVAALDTSLKAVAESVVQAWDGGGTPTVGERFAMAMASRRFGIRQRGEAPPLEGASDDELRQVSWHLTTLGLWDETTKRERAMLAERIQARPPNDRRATPAEHGDWPDAFGGVPDLDHPMRTMGPFPKGFAADLVKVSGCVGTPDLVGARVAFRADRRPASVDIMAGQLSPECVQVVRTLASVSVAMPEEPTSTAMLIESLAPETLACPAEYTPGLVRYSVSPLLGPAANVVSPVVRGDVPVVDPQAARRANVQGVVVVRIVVADSGCVSAVDVHRSIPFLDVPAVAVALKWSFSPPSNDGVPTSTALRRFINFKF